MVPCLLKSLREKKKKHKWWFLLPMLDISQPSSSEGFSGDGDGFLMLESRILLALDPKRKKLWLQIVWVSPHYNICCHYNPVLDSVFFFYHQSRWIHDSSLLIPKIEEVHSYLIYFFCGFLFIQPPMQLDGKGTQSWYCDNVKLLSSHILFYHDI